MATYISILRGINVSGKNLIKMDALRKCYADMGLQEVNTYVQSGNVVFKAKKASPAKLALKISEQIENDFGLQVPVIVLTVELLQQIIDENPLPSNPLNNPAFMHVSFLAAVPGAFDQAAVEAKIQAGEQVRFSDKAIYLYCPDGYGKTKLTNNFLESKLKVTITTRNWKTVNELFQMAQK